METNTISISLSESLKAFVEDQVAAGGFSTKGDYIHNLIREAQKSKAREKVDALLLEGLNSGPAREMTSADWEELRSKARERARQRNGE